MVRLQDTRLTYNKCQLLPFIPAMNNLNIKLKKLYIDCTLKNGYDGRLHIYFTTIKKTQKRLTYKSNKKGIRSI